MPDCLQDAVIRKERVSDQIRSGMSRHRIWRSCGGFWSRAWQPWPCPVSARYLPGGLAPKTHYDHDPLAGGK
jgi:hypothetical protein